jgi:F5/8 type C domain-containing protein/double zinc ribbon protein
METTQRDGRTCRHCHAPVGDGARFCESCGAALAAERPCRSCGAALGPRSRYCAGCGNRVGASPRTNWRAEWERVLGRIRGVDWARVGLVASPIAALGLAGLAGYALGRHGASPTSSSPRLVSAARGWRAETARPRGGPSDGGENDLQRLNTPAGPPLRLSPGPTPASPPTRFRDFRISASSWEVAHPPEAAADGNPYTFWHAWKTEKFPEGEWLTLTFPTERVVSRIGLLPGRQGPGARAEGRVRSLMVKASDAPPQKLFFQDRPALQYRDLTTPVRTRKLILRIGKVLPGWETHHIIVPELQVWGYPAAGQQVARSSEKEGGLTNP